MKYFLFDIGNVLVDFDFGVLCQAIAEAAGKRETIFSEQDLEMHDAVEKGHISDAEWVDYLNRAMGISWTVDDLTAVWSRMFTINPTGHSLFERASDAGVAVYTLSNIARHHINAIENNWTGFFDGATGLFLSYQMGVRKPDPLIFRKTLHQLGAEGRQCFFIDDRPENIEAARDEGIEAHWFVPENHAAIKDAVNLFFDLS